MSLFCNAFCKSSTRCDSRSRAQSLRTLSEQTCVVSVWQTIRSKTRQSCNARANLHFFEGRIDTCKAQIQQDWPKCHPLSGAVGTATPRNHAFGTGNATQPWKRHAAFSKRDNVPGHAAQRHATPGSRSSFARPQRKRHAILQRATKVARRAAVARQRTVARQRSLTQTHCHRAK